MSDVWEPWKPEIGQRVRVRLSPECDAKFVAYAIKTKMVVSKPEHHYREAHGAVGTITDAVPLGEEQISGHRFKVSFDRIVRVPGRGRLHGICLAAIELERIQ